MNTINRKKSIIAAVGAAVTAAAVPALLFAGAGTAQAFTGVNLTPDPSGVTVHINSVGIGIIGPEGVVEPAIKDGVPNDTVSHGQCTYTAVPPLGPATTKKFPLRPGGTADLWFPGIPTGTTWNVTIDCPNGVDSPTQQLVY